MPTPFNPYQLNLNRGYEPSLYADAKVKLKKSFGYPAKPESSLTPLETYPTVEESVKSDRLGTSGDNLSAEDVLTNTEQALDFTGRNAPFAIAATNFGTQLAWYKKMRDRKLALQPRLLGPAHSRIAPVRGLPSEVSANYINNINSQAQTLTTSDPTLNMISMSVANAQKRKGLDSLAGMEAETALRDRQRFDSETKQDQLSNIARSDSNIAKLEAKDKADAVADVVFRDQQRQTIGAGLTGLQKGLNTKAGDNFAANQMKVNSEVNYYSGTLSRLQNQLSMTPSDQYATISGIKAQILTAEGNLQKAMRQGYEDHGEINSHTFRPYKGASYLVENK